MLRNCEWSGWMFPKSACCISNPSWASSGSIRFTRRPADPQRWLHVKQFWCFNWINQLLPHWKNNVFDWIRWVITPSLPLEKQFHKLIQLNSALTLESCIPCSIFTVLTREQDVKLEYGNRLTEEKKLPDRLKLLRNRQKVKHSLYDLLHLPHLLWSGPKFNKPVTTILLSLPHSNENSIKSELTPCDPTQQKRKKRKVECHMSHRGTEQGDTVLFSRLKLRWLTLSAGSGKLMTEQERHSNATNELFHILGNVFSSYRVKGKTN